MIQALGKFTYEIYSNLMKLLQTKYRIIPFREVQQVNPPYLLLRHDVDASLEAALEMAKLENTLNIKSTYFVLFSYKLYNLLEKSSLQTVKEISSLGHEIGLHYDLDVYESFNRDIPETMEQEIKLLETIVSRPIVSIARHNASMQTQEDVLMKANYINAYNDNLYDAYASDSCRAWDIESLSRLLTFQERKAQLLIHPFMWKNEHISRNEVIECFFQKISDENRKYKKRWKKIWNENLKVIKYEEEIEAVSD